MRKLFNFFAAALVMLAAASCEKNEVLPDNNSEGKVVTLNASINNGGTKTSLGPGVQEGSNSIQYPVYWSENDAIAVIQQEDLQDGSVYIFTLSEGGAGKASATFECNNAYGFDPNLPYRAVYPASSVVLSDGKFDGYSFSATQSYVQNSFGVSAMPMQTTMCIGTERPLSFTNEFGVLKLQLKGAADEKVTSIVVTSDKALNGEAQLDGGAITLQGTSDENKKVTLDCSANGGVALNQGTATDFHIALPAGVHELSVCFVTNKGVYYKTTEQTIESGRIIKMASLNTETSSDFPNGNMSYVENGVYLGEGVALPASEGKTIIWAPVNCGYDEDHKYGLLYQWGRKYGQGYTDEGDVVNFINERPTLATGAAEANRNKFYKGDAYNSNGGYGDWLAQEDRSSTLWNENEGGKGSPVKTEYDPCPEGWRVPTNNELVTLLAGIQGGSSDSKTAPSDQVEKTDDIKGFWAKNEVGVNKVFFPVYYVLNYDSTGEYTGGGNNSLYWSSTAGDSNNAMSEVLMMALSTFSGNLTLQATERSRACGYSVRCVKDMPQSQPMPGSN